MSVSRTNQYSECPYRYYLERIEKVWQKPAAWFPQGTAFHEAIEVFEKSGRSMSLEDVQALYLQLYREHVNGLLAVTPNAYAWFASGPYRGPQDIPRREQKGWDQIKMYLDWCEANPDKKPWTTPDGELALETPFQVEMGGIPVRGYIDQIRDDHGATDYKTGNRDGDPFQLWTYKIAIEKTFDYEIAYGDFWRGKTGKTSKPIDLTLITEDQVAEIHGEAYQGIKDEKFDPIPDPDKCNFCSVRHACEFSA